MQQQTLAIIKPDGVARNLIGEIIGRIEAHGLRIQAMKMIHLSKPQAEAFYAVHRERPFFQSLTDFMSEGPVVSMLLSGENAIQEWRDLMGATGPVTRTPGTHRSESGQSIERNPTHRSEGQETA